jgi:26S proteasome regulatory subunit N3
MKTAFPEQASNNQQARYLYYMGRIKAVQLEYSEAQARLIQALRKGPEIGAKGFRI